MQDSDNQYIIAADFINQMLPPLKPADTIEKALEWMRQFRVRALAVVENGEYKGMVEEETLIDANEAHKTIAETKLLHQDVHVFEQQHFYEVIKEAERHNLQNIAVLDNDRKYQGIISVGDTFTALARNHATRNPGGIVVIAMKEYEYSMAEIARLVESNSVKILSSYIENDPTDLTAIKLTLKLNKIDLTHVIATLERFGYHVVARFQETPAFQHEKERLDLLMRYLEI